MPANPARRAGRIPSTDVAAHDAALVEAAARLFREHGFASVSIDMIAREAAVSPKTIYARHEGKLGLFKAAIAAMTAHPVDVWGTLERKGDLEEVLVEAADRFLAAVLSPEVLAMERAIIAEAPRLPELADTFYAQGPRRGLARLAAFFAHQAERGALRIGNGNRSAEAFVGLIEGELVRRALFLGQTPTPRERRAWVRFGVSVFLRAHAPA